MRSVTAALLCLTLAGTADAGCAWPLWEQFRHGFVDAGGRVIDHSDPRTITTSEGQSYALFFALVAGDRPGFERLLRWTENNLAQGDLQRHLPAWLWGRTEDGRWQVLDDNSAADADLWIAYSLQEAGRLWRRDDYAELSTRLLALVRQHEVAVLPQLGPLLLPGAHGFASDGRWTLNPSYSPLPLLRSFAKRHPRGDWPEVLAATQRMLAETTASGFAPDWVDRQDDRWQPSQRSGWLGDYDAIRVYLWAGMQADADLQRYRPMLRYLEEHGYPPLRTDSQAGTAEGQGPPGFSAALLPLLGNTPDRQSLERQLERLANTSLAPQAYYDHVLSLFGLGWHEGRYRFTADGFLLLPNAEECP
ncbi:cellulose synthase complex periplasmic endoglucanase BcsZ [Zestomonas carbonaria]|uniref:cellulase n=1 Tax=Zestomonas carbonaria TaxID=2762745 RepID=A0A7U7IAM5_9GAMM|nr:cellulose synthase complex periplasmic endoglucanase BcsZ [Pseudomonas carbonaria]CAD5109614.1 Endoglucanase [Pseudomonas carbonaria]